MKKYKFELTSERFGLVSELIIQALCMADAFAQLKFSGKVHIRFVGVE